MPVPFLRALPALLLALPPARAAAAGYPPVQQIPMH
jgi:hypothetical protein